MEKKYLAIQFFGHLRTYQKTYQLFYKNIIEINLKDGWHIDIFMHTWDKFNSSDKSWHSKSQLFKNNKKLNLDDINTVRKIYQVKKIKIESLPEGEHGGLLSKRAGNKIREEYEILNNIKYNYILYTRPDILFLNPLRLNSYLEEYKKYSFLKLPPKHAFCGNNFFRRMSIADPRYINEGDIVYFSSESQDCFRCEQNKDFLVIPIDYTLHKDFFLQRENFIHGWNTHPIVLLKNQSTQLNQIQSKLSFQTKYGTAKTRIQNQLSYKLGQAMIANSKSLLGYIRMPFVLSYIYDKHKQEQKIYQEKIKKDPSLKLPILEDYPDYKEALKVKNHLSYKLGQALIQANKNWYGGGYIKLLFEIRKLKRENYTKKDIR